MSGDTSSSANGGVYQPFGTTPGFGQPGSAIGDPSTAVAFDGSTEFLSSSQAVPSPTTYSVETWIKTTTTQGGKIVGFGDNQGGLDFGGNPQMSGSYDKQIYMDNDGHLIFGVYIGGTDTLTSQNASTTVSGTTSSARRVRPACRSMSTATASVATA